jgi:hypothetical protein
VLRMKIPFLARGLAVLLVATALVGVSRGQGGRQQLGNSEVIEKAYKAIKYEFTQQANGSKPPIDADLELAAKYFVYRVTWDDSLTSKGESVLAKGVTEFNDLVEKETIGRLVLGQKSDTSKFKTDWSKKLVARFRELTDLPFLDNSRAVLLGAQMFPALARMQQEEAGAYLQELVDDKSNRPGQDAIRLFALRALGEFLPVSPWGEPTGQFDFKSKANLLKKERDLARIDVLTRFILRAPPTPPVDPEILEAYRFIRREAIETLAKAGSPAVSSYRDNAGSKAEGPIAVTLMKVLVPGSLNPPPTLAERNEAALGLCSLKGTSTYDGRWTLPFIAFTLIEMNKTYAEDKPNIKAGQAHFLWKIEGARWKKALETLVDGVNGPFNKDPEGMKLAETFEGKAKGGEMATATINAWMKHDNSVNTLKIEKFTQDNSPKGNDITIFKDIASPGLKWDRGGPAAE